MPERLRAVVLAPHLNPQGLGEVYSIFKWVEALSERVDLTILTLRPGPGLAEALPQARLITFDEPRILNRLPRFNAMAKPWLPIFFAKARKWIQNAQSNGETFDVAHQILPQAMRYTCPLTGLGIPYVVGPLGGSLKTPEAFGGEERDTSLVTSLRNLDRWRLKYDRRLRRGYESADLILGVAPYVNETLQAAGLRIKRFEPVLERGFEGERAIAARQNSPEELTLLHVGRAVRTKGLRDVLRALAQLQDLPGVRLISAGDGPDLEACRGEAVRLGIQDRVTFLGRVPREDVDRLYQEADVFCFPSYREPMGGVFFEAMSFGLPVIAADRGGPAFILDDASAIKLAVETPQQFATDIAGAIRALAMDPARRDAMGQAALTRLRSFGDLSDKAALLETFYRDIAKTTSQKIGSN